MLDLPLDQPTLSRLHSVLFFLSGALHRKSLPSSCNFQNLHQLAFPVWNSWHLSQSALGYPHCFSASEFQADNIFFPEHRESSTVFPRKGDNLCHFFNGKLRGVCCLFSEDVNRSSSQVKTGQRFSALPLSSCVWANDASSLQYPPLA